MFAKCCAQDAEGSQIEAIAVPFDSQDAEGQPKVPDVEHAKVEDVEQPKPQAKEEETKAADTGNFTVTLCRESTRAPWGFVVDLSDVTRVHICRIDDGGNAATIYNNDARESEQLQVFDDVVAINGTRLTTDATNGPDPNMLMAGLSSALEAQLTLKRPQIFDSTVMRNGKPLGLEVNFYGKGASLGISTIVDDGVAQGCMPKLQVGDRIIAVNGTKGGHDVLQQALGQAESSVTLTISRRQM